MEPSQATGNGYKAAVVEAVKGIQGGPRSLHLYMEICARCGTCAAVCPVYYGSARQDRHPVVRSDLIRSVYKRHATLSGRLLGGLNGAKDFADEDLQEWQRMFYECTGCRRCAIFCPLGIDNSIVTRKGRAILHKLGLTPKRLVDVTNVSLQTGNTDGASPAAFLDCIHFLEEEMQEETGIDVKIPVDVEGAEVLFIPPSGDVLVNPEAIMGIAKVFHVLGMSWTMSSHAFDGANYGLFTGDDTSMKADNKICVDAAQRIGCKTLMMGECGHAYRIMKRMMEIDRWWGELPFRIVNVMEFTADAVAKGKIKLDPSRNPEPATYHDPCNFARSCGIVEEPRFIMRAACADYREMTPSGAENWCCGGGGGLSAMDDIREFRMTVSGVKKVEQVKETGARFVAAPCSNCKRQLLQLMEYHGLEVQVGGLHDLVSRAIVME